MSIDIRRKKERQGTMHRFSRHAPLDMKPRTDPGPEDRSGPPLSRGSLFSLLAMVAAEDLPAETLKSLPCIDPEAWYLGQDFETMISQLEDKDAELPEIVGRNIYFMFRTGFQQMGIQTVSQLFTDVPAIWLFATRGDSGVWRSQKLGELHFCLELEQPYNCIFEMGAMRGFIEAYDGRDVVITQGKCMRRGDAFCAFDIRWEE